MKHPDNEARTLAWEDHKLSNFYKRSLAVMSQYPELTCEMMFNAGWEQSLLRAIRVAELDYNPGLSPTVAGTIAAAIRAKKDEPHG